jgi:acetyltransferase-like isoleucine patch superfamily enzyme
MSFQEISTSKIYHKFNEKAAGEVIVTGFYLGTTEGRFGVQHSFKTLEGQIHVLNSSGHLNYSLEQVAVGEFVRITYLGEVTLTKGAMVGKKAHNFKLEKDTTVKQGVSPDPVEVGGPVVEADPFAV